MNSSSIESIVESLFTILPLFKKKLLKPGKYHEEYDLSPSHVQILFLLDDVGLIPISEIGKILCISNPNMTPLVRTLISNNLVERIRDENDRRYVNIGMTEEGKKLIANHKSFMAKELKTKLSILNDEDLIKLSESLHNVKEIMLGIE